LDQEPTDALLSSFEVLDLLDQHWAESDMMPDDERKALLVESPAFVVKRGHIPDPRIIRLRVDKFIEN
jgi:hypothetical protein